MRPLLLLALAACGRSNDPVTTSAVDQVELLTRVEVSDAGKRELVVMSTGPRSTTWTLDVPSPPKLKLGEPSIREELVGDRVIRTHRYAFTGGKGSYIIENVCATPEGADPICASPLYLDIDVEMDRSTMVDIDDPAALLPLPPFGLVLGALAGISLMGFGVWRAIRLRPPEQVTVIEEEPPDLVAIRRWNAIRSDDQLSDFDKALALSEVFRAYAASVLRFPAEAFTTTETLAHLTSLAALPRDNVPRARRLLRATDRVKYAEARPGEDFFEDLDSDLRAFIDSTRPRTWDQT